MTETTPGPGHNGISGQMLRSFVERIETIEAEKRELSADISGIYKEAKGQGFDTKVVREMVKLRRMDALKIIEHEELRDLYMHSLGMLADTPLGEAAMRRAGVDPAQTDIEDAAG